MAWVEKKSSGLHIRLIVTSSLDSKNAFNFAIRLDSVSFVTTRICKRKFSKFLVGWRDRKYKKVVQLYKYCSIVRFPGLSSESLSILRLCLGDGSGVWSIRAQRGIGPLILMTAKCKFVDVNKLIALSIWSSGIDLPSDCPVLKSKAAKMTIQASIL